MYHSHRIHSLLLALVTLYVSCTATHIKIPYHICHRLDDAQDTTPGICAGFGTNHIVINIEESYTDEEIRSICSSDYFGFYTSMADAILDWSLEGCIGYMKYFIDPELLAQKLELENINNNIQKKKTELEILGQLSNIQDTHDSQVEGGLWRGGYEDDEATIAKLAKKRACFKGTLSIALPENAHLAEIGFNGGHSTAMMLHMFPSLKITSFDMCAWRYTKPAHEHLKTIFGSRTELICGDSGQTLKMHTPPPEKYDVMFVDGGHLYSQARSDIFESSKLVKSGAMVIVDDCDGDMANANTTMGIDQVNDAWRHMIAYGIVKPLPELFDTCEHSGLCIGRFV